jgi:hypothetical protein
MSALTFSEELELVHQCGSQRNLTSAQAAHALFAAGFADLATCTKLVDLAAAKRRRTNSSKSNAIASEDAADWTLSRLIACARSCKSIRDAGTRPPLLLGVPGGAKYVGGLDEHYEGTVTAQHKAQYAMLSSALISSTLVAPLERAKTLMMVHPLVSNAAANAGAPTSYNSLWNTLQHIRSTESTKALWRGNMASVAESWIRAMAYSSAYFFLRRRVVNHEIDTGVPLTIRDALAVGAGTSILGSIASYPFQVVRSRMHVYDAQRFPSLSQSLVRIGVHEGFGGLFRGFAVSSLGLGLYIGLDTLIHRSLLSTPVPSFAQSSNQAAPTFAAQQRLDLVTGLPLVGNASALSYAFAGALGTLSVQTGTIFFSHIDPCICIVHSLVFMFVASALFPLNVIRRRLQIQDRLPAVYKSGVDCFDQILYKEGVRGFFRGYSAHVACAVPLWTAAYVMFSMQSDVLDEQNRLIDAYFGTQKK